MSRHVLYDATLGALALKQVRNANLTSNGQVINAVTSAGVLADIMGGRKDLRATFESDDVGSVAAVANIATAGLAVSGGTIAIPFLARSNLSTFAAGASHYAVSGTNGLIVPTQFAVQDTGPATVGLECVFVSTDGETAPVSELGSQTLAASSFVGLYGMGPVVVTTAGPVNTVLDRPSGFTVRPGITMRPEFARGKNYAEEAFIVPPVVPVIEVTCYDLDSLLGSLGGWGAILGLTCYLRKRSQTGFVADASLAHIKFSFADGITDVGISGSGGGADALKTYTFYGEALTIAAGVAIT